MSIFDKDPLDDGDHYMESALTPHEHLLEMCIWPCHPSRWTLLQIYHEVYLREISKHDFICIRICQYRIISHIIRMEPITGTELRIWTERIKNTSPMARYWPLKMSNYRICGLFWKLNIGKKQHNFYCRKSQINIKMIIQ